MTDGEIPLVGALVRVCLRMSHKNDFYSFHGPSNKEGIVNVTRDAITFWINEDIKFGLMDFSDPKVDFANAVIVGVASRDSLRKAEEAFPIFSKHTQYPEGYLEHLDQAKAAIKTARDIRVELIGFPSTVKVDVRSAF